MGVFGTPSKFMYYISKQINDKGVLVQQHKISGGPKHDYENQNRNGYMKLNMKTPKFLFWSNLTSNKALHTSHLIKNIRTYWDGDSCDFYLHHHIIKRKQIISLNKPSKESVIPKHTSYRVIPNHIDLKSKLERKISISLKALRSK